MSAEDLGARLLGEVREGRLDMVRIFATPRTISSYAHANIKRSFSNTSENPLHPVCSTSHTSQRLTGY